MNDYKELLECLKIRSETNHNGNWWDNAVADDIDRAIDAIERLIEAFEHCKSELDITRKFIKDNDLVWELNSYCRRNKNV